MDNDSTLICRAQAGDEGAFVDLIRAYHPFVYAIVVEIVDNLQDAEEIVQDTFLNVYRGLAQYEERAKFKTWLAEIARNRARSWLRKHRVNTIPIDEVSEHTLQTPDAPDEQLILSEQRELIRRALGTLSPKDREIAHSYYLDGAGYDELMSTHGLSYKAISVRLSRAKQKLAKRLGNLLTGVFVSPITSLKQIYSGGLTVMKVGTVPKITAGAVVIIVLAFIGTRQFILSKEDSSPSVEVVTSTPNESANSVAQADAMRKRAVTAPPREDKPQISEEEMEQIEDFFAQLEGADPQSEMDTPQSPAGTEAAQNTDEHITTYTDAFVEDIEQSAEEVMSAFVEAFRNLDYDAMHNLLTAELRERASRTAHHAPFSIIIGNIRSDFADEVPAEAIEDMANRATRRLEQQMLEPVLEMLNQAQVVSSEHVGDEFYFRLGMPAPEIPSIPGVEIEKIPAPPNELIKMRKENGVWRIYDHETLD